jgi:hypothetical protein
MPSKMTEATVSTTEKQVADVGVKLKILKKTNVQ